MVDTVGQVDYILKQSQKTRSIGTVTFAWISLISNFLGARTTKKSCAHRRVRRSRGSQCVPECTGWSEIYSTQRFVHQSTEDDSSFCMSSTCRIRQSNLNRQLYFYCYIIHTYTRSFSETLFKSKKFKNAAFRFKVGGLDFVELFENDDLTWFPRSSFPRTQIHNDSWLSRFQFSQA